jgi:hypothetical protein
LIILHELSVFYILYELYVPPLLCFFQGRCYQILQYFLFISFLVLHKFSGKGTYLVTSIVWDQWGCYNRSAGEHTDAGAGAH